MKIEERLKESEKSFSNSSILWAQWCFDKQLLSKSLNAISNFFPHYSLHESSHSNSILTEIEKIIQSNVINLSFIDCWLLLEAAYWHDVGMVVTNEEIEEIIKDENFILFIDSLVDNVNDLSQYAAQYKAFLAGEIKSGILELENSFKFLIAEYIRKKHAERSKDILKEPSKYGILSPNSGLINSRIYNILGDILASHGKPFESVLALPFENDGLEVGDIAHPRYIACLLRLGDLLDIDDGRYCLTYLKTINNIPSLSYSHFKKHNSIVSKTVNENIIDIKSNCTDYDTFELQNDWFSFIEKEIENQDKYWGNIVSNNYANKLPTIKALVCELENSIAFPKRTSRLTLDSDRIYNFLIGKEIYENKFAAINEILQNAVDATIDRIWLEKNREIISDIERFRNEVAINYPINVKVEEKKKSEGKIEYEISIADIGKGMNLDDIKLLLTVASEENQNKKNILRKDMPEWMKPSGMFGVGLQSVFSLTDKIKILTKSAEDKQYELIINATQGKTPSFVVKRIETSSWNFGTTVSFSIWDEMIPERLSGNRVIYNELAHFDPIKDEILPAVVGQLSEIVSEFSMFCHFPILFNNEKIINKQIQFQILDIPNGIEYNIEFFKDSRPHSWLYRGRSAKANFVSYCRYFNIFGNIIAGKADEFLSLSRENIHNSGANILTKKVMASISSKKSDILNAVTNKDIANLYYFLNNDKSDIESEDNWKDIKLNKKPISHFLQLTESFDVSFDYYYTDIKDIIGRIDTCVLLDVLKKLNKGLIIENIEKREIDDNNHLKGKQTITVYSLKITDNKSCSRIEGDAILFLASEKLSNTRTRYCLSVGEEQYKEITIPCNSYSWVENLLPWELSEFFSRWIVLHSTHIESIDEDIPILATAIIKFNNSYSITEIAQKLQEFYREYHFEVTKDKNVEKYLSNS